MTDDAARRRAIELVGEHWPELSKRLRQWLGQASRDDESLVGEVAFLMMRRYANRNGMLFAYLRANPGGGGDRDKEVLFGEAKWVYREVLPSVVGQRRRAIAQSSLPDDDAWQVGWEACGPSDFVEGHSGWNLDAPPHRIPQVSGNGEEFVAAIDVLLSRGEQVWDSLCDDGVLDRSAWTDGEKWTAIAAMWGLDVREVGVVCHIKAGTGRPGRSTDEATRRRRRKVRDKGTVLRDATPHANLAERDLLGRRHRAKG